MVRYMPEVLCFNCVAKGGVTVFLDPTPMLTCSICDWMVTGYYSNGYVVFPDPHANANPGKLDNPVPSM